MQLIEQSLVNTLCGQTENKKFLPTETLEIKGSWRRKAFCWVVGVTIAIVGRTVVNAIDWTV